MTPSIDAEVPALEPGYMGFFQGGEAAALRTEPPARLYPPAETAAHTARVEAHGKFLARGDEKFWIRGVTYGTFRDNAESLPFPEPDQVAHDFAQMQANGFNTVRVYTPPPRWLLDTAMRHGLQVMVGLPWEQHVAFLDSPRVSDDIVARVAEAVRPLADHPAVLCYAVGNEIPASVVRWHGRRRVERFIKRLYDAVKAQDPAALVTYVNFPTTEYLQLPFLDLVCFNVYLESEERLSAYLARLQNLAGERPLILAELGLDSLRNGPDVQAGSLSWQLRTCFAAGCAGTFVFAWTDEWHRGGFDIDDWDFGLTTRERAPKPALEAVREVFADLPFPAGMDWPSVSVVVCSYNGARTIRDTLEALRRVTYPDFEVIVVNDGSRDATPGIAESFGVRVISTENRGLSAARNTGWQAAAGEIVAYIDDDAYPDPHWLHYLAFTFLTTDHAGVGGPNLAPPGDGPIADCVANAPGGPVQVLLTDTLAEHIPGCNMAFRRTALAAVGGFDPRYRAAGDDVDLCWRVMEEVGTIGFHPAALVWHHRRNSLARYWRQQKGYGKAEALLEEKGPERYNAAGHLRWSGRLYGRGFTEALPLKPAHVYQGTWGSAGYQSLYQRDPGTLLSLPQMPEWYLVLGLLAVLALLGAFWAPLAALAWPLLAIAVAAPVAQAVLAGSRAEFPGRSGRVEKSLPKSVLTAVLHLVQPAARLIGRIEHGLTPWRRRGRMPAGQRGGPQVLWSETWQPSEAWAQGLEHVIRKAGVIVRRGGDYDAWDFELRGGLMGGVRGVIAVEEHGGGKQLVRTRTRPQVARPVWIFVLLMAVLAVFAIADGAWLAGAGLSLLAGVFAASAWRDVGAAAGAWQDAVRRLGGGGPENA